MFGRQYRSAARRQGCPCSRYRCQCCCSCRKHCRSSGGDAGESGLDVPLIVDGDAAVARRAGGTSIGLGLNAGAVGGIDIALIFDGDTTVAVSAGRASPAPGENAGGGGLDIARIVDGDAGVTVGIRGTAIA